MTSSRLHLLEPYRIKTPTGEPYLDRWSIPLPFGWSIKLHRIRCPDWSPDCHDHPYPFVTFVLWGRYTEVVRVPDGVEFRLVDWFNRKWNPTVAHNIVTLSRRSVWTLGVYGKRCSVGNGGLLPPTAGFPGTNTNEEIGMTDAAEILSRHFTADSARRAMYADSAFVLAVVFPTMTGSRIVTTSHGPPPGKADDPDSWARYYATVEQVLEDAKKQVAAHILPVIVCEYCLRASCLEGEAGDSCGKNVDGDVKTTFRTTAQLRALNREDPAWWIPRGTFETSATIGVSRGTEDDEAMCVRCSAVLAGEEVLWIDGDPYCDDCACEVGVPE